MATSEPPTISPCPIAGPRPRFSVMLPTFEPDLRLGHAVASVLTQAPPPDEMQIVVVDDGSQGAGLESIVRKADPHGRVEIVRHAERLGLAGNWNRAIGLARGELVHLLHQDDHVRPGFYARIDRGFRRCPTAAMAFCRSCVVDDADRVIKTSSRLRWFAGPLRNWIETIAKRQRVETPAVVVARRTYETLGGYRHDLAQTLDWEMWVRIAARHPVWYEPRILAVYRRHAGNESSRLLSKGVVWPDAIRAIGINADSLPDSRRNRITAASGRWHAGSALRHAGRQLAAGDVAAAAAVLQHVQPLLALAAGDPGLPRVRRKLAALEAAIVAAGGRVAPPGG